MTKRKEPEPKTESYERYVCESCDGSSAELDITWLHYDPVLVCRTESKWLSKSSRKHTHDTYSKAISIDSKWVVGICEDCLGAEPEKENNVKVNSDKEIETDNPPAPSNRIVNNKVEDYTSVTDTVENYYCDICGSKCRDHETLFENPRYNINNRKTKLFGNNKCYVSRNWFNTKSPDWSDVVYLKYNNEFHLCGGCFSDISGSMVTEIKTKLSRLLRDTKRS